MQETPIWQDHHRTGQAALRSGDLGAAEAALAAGFAAVRVDSDGADLGERDPKAPVALILLQADLYLAAGDLTAAETLIAAHSKIRPHIPWLWYKAADVALKQGDIAGAWAHLATGQALDEDACRAAPKLTAARLWQAMQEPARAKAVLRGLARLNGDDIQGLLALARLEAEAGRPGAAADCLAEARARAPGRADLVLLQGRYLGDAEALADAIALYEAFQADHGVDVMVTLRLAAAYRSLGDTSRAAAALAQAVATHPLEPTLLREVFRTQGQAADSPRIGPVLARLKGRIEPALYEDLSVHAHLARLDYAEALALLRGRKRARRDVQEAHQLVSALIGAGRFELGLRYLRLCLRRWPGPGFLAPIVYHGLRLGRVEQVAALLADPGPDIPARVLHGLRFTLAGYQGDFETVQREYEALAALGAATHTIKMQFARMLFIWLEPYGAETFFSRIPHPFDGIDAPLHRGGLPGQMMQEYELERRALPQDGSRWSLTEWMQARPGSTMAAIRLVDAWRAGKMPRHQDAGDPVPRRIYQYWDAPKPPREVTSACETWADIPGFRHTMMNRAEATAYLRDHFEPGFLQAFRLSQNSAQEADFLRLCILSREGGVWADADDCLYGNLETVLGDARGLILFREPMGAALGNNFLAAPPGHPVIRHAARLASMALRRRDNETTWSKTGPGLLTRAVGHYLARKEPQSEGARITILDWPQVARHIAMHNTMAYKRTSAHWNAEAVTPGAPVWEQLAAALAEAP